MTASPLSATSAATYLIGTVGFIFTIVGVWLDLPVKDAAKKVMPEVMARDPISVRYNYSSYVWDGRVPYEIKRRHVDAHLWWGIALVFFAITAYYANWPIAAAVLTVAAIWCVLIYFYWRRTRLKIGRRDR